MAKLLISYIQKVVEYNIGYGVGYEIHLKKKILKKFQKFETNVHVIPRWVDSPVYIYGVSDNKISKRKRERTSNSLTSKTAASYAIKKLKFSNDRDKARYKLMS